MHIHAAGICPLCGEIITHMAIYEFPDSSTPLLTFPTTNSARVTSGTTMKRLHLPMEALSVKGTDKES